MAEPQAFLSGKEPLLLDGKPFSDDLGTATVVDFWRWAFSGIKNDVIRGNLAEYIVARLIGEAGNPRPPTTLYDICTSGGVHIEIKCSAHVNEYRDTETVPSFGGLKRQKWDYETGRVRYHPTDYQSHIYVLALLTERDRGRLNPLELSQWLFYVLTRQEVQEVAQDGRSISLRRLQQYDCAPCTAGDLKNRVVEAIDRHKSAR